MKIKEFTINNFRSIKNQKLSFGDFNIFIGKNNSGKSTVLMALAYFFEKIGIVRNESTIDSANLSFWPRGIVSGSIELTAKFELNKEECKRFDDIFGSNCFSADLWVEIKESVETPGRTRTELFFPQFPNSIRVKKNDFQNLIIYIRNIFSFIPANRMLTKESLGQQGSTLVYGHNFKNILHRMLISEDINEKNDFETIKNEIRTIDSEFGLLDFSSPKFDPSFQQGYPTELEVSFKEGNFLVKSPAVGTGLHESLIILSSIIPQKNNIIAIEEPGIHLHNGAQRVLFNLLKKYSKSKQIIITTHSTIFVNNSFEDNMFLVKKEESLSKISKLESEEELKSLLVELGAKNSDLLLSEAIVFVEGESDKETLRILFNKHIGELGVSFIPLGGTRYPNRFEIATKVTKNLGIPCFYIRDSDNVINIKEMESQLNSKGLISKVLEKRTIEEYLLDPEAISKTFGISLTEVKALLESNKSKSAIEILGTIARTKDLEYKKTAHNPEIAMSLDKLPKEIEDFFKVIKSKVTDKKS